MKFCDIKACPVCAVLGMKKHMSWLEAVRWTVYFSGPIVFDEGSVE